MSSASSADPIAEIVADRERARSARDLFADLCILATADAKGAPGARTLVLRDVGPHGVGLLVSATSPKWAPLAEDRYECLLGSRRSWCRNRCKWTPRGRSQTRWP